MKREPRADGLNGTIERLPRTEGLLVARSPRRWLQLGVEAPPVRRPQPGRPRGQAAAAADPRDAPGLAADPIRRRSPARRLQLPRRRHRLPRRHCCRIRNSQVSQRLASLFLE